MTKSSISNYLNKFDYKFIEHEKSFIVDLDFSLQIIIELMDNGKIKITDQLKGLNFLTWPFPMSIKSSMIYNTIGLIVFTLLILVIEKSYSQFFLTIIYMCAIFAILFWMIYYFVKAENFKKQIIDLITHQ